MRKLLLVLSIFIVHSLFSYEIGEELTFELSYGVIKAANSSIKIDSTTYNDSIKCLKITSLTSTNKFFDKLYKVRDKIESVWNREQNFSYKFEKKLHEGKYRQNRIHYYYPDQNFTIYLKKDKKATKYKEKRFNIPDNTHDILSGFYWIRNQEMVVGDTLFSELTVDGKSYIGGIRVLRREKIKSIYGLKECLVVEPMLQSSSIFKQTGNIYIWLSADENRIPLKIESKVIFGSFKAILTEVKNVTYKKK